MDTHPAIDPYHSAAMLSLGGIKSFVFARQASAIREFSARFAVQKQSFYSRETQHGRRVTKVYSIERFSIDCRKLVCVCLARLLWFCITTLCDWLTKLAPLSQPMGIKTNCVLAARVFPRLAPVTCICFEF